MSYRPFPLRSDSGYILRWQLNNEQERGKSMAHVRTLALVSAVLALSGCALFSKQDKPVDISKGAPSVGVVIQAVQDAIDSTATNRGWQGSELFRQMSSTCQSKNQDARAAHQVDCATQVADARKACGKLSGPTAPALCTDHLQAANIFCSKAPGPADECKMAEAVAPIIIKSATLKFSAANAQEGSIGADLRLISAAHTRKYGRTSSFEIELVPDPTREIHAIDGTNRYNLDELGALLLAALNAGTSCTERTTKRDSGVDAGRGLTCELSKAPQLILKSAKFGMDISYTQSSSGEIKWSVSSLRLDEGTAGLSSSRTIGNTLMIELARGG